MTAFKQYDKNKVWKHGYTDLVDENDKLLALTKKEKANGNKLHQWTLKSTWERMAFYRCVVCDFIDSALSGHTPEPREPYCPAKLPRIYRSQ